jgi:WD40 repeat protein
MDGTIKIWPAAAPDPQVVFKNGSGWVGTVAFHPDGGKVATAHNGGIRVWDPRTGEELWRVIGPRGLLGRIGLIFSKDGKHLFASGPDRTVNAYDATTGRIVRELFRSSQSISDMVLSPDGSILAVAREDGSIGLANAPGSDSPPRTLIGHSAAVNALAFSFDGHFLASAGEDLKVRVWDLATGKEARTLSGHATGVKDVAFSPDGKQIASVGGQYRGTPAAEVFLWDWKGTSGGLIRRLEGHTGLVTAVAFFPDGRRLATASDDRSIKLWDPATGDDVFTLRGHTSGVVSLAISRDGKLITSGSIDCTARVWSSEPPSVDIAQVRRRAAVNLVQSLFESKLLKSEVVAALEADRSLDPQLRTPALEIARRRSDDAQGLYEAAWLTIVRPTGTPELYSQALKRLQAAFQMSAGDPDRQSEYRHILCLALYRAGHADEALELATRLRKNSASSATKPAVIDVAVTALASQKLGHLAEAREALERLQALVKPGPGADQEALGFLREAESSVHR